MLKSLDLQFTLITGNYLYHSGRLSLKADKLKEIMSEAVAELNAEDAMALGITEGIKVRVKSKSHEAYLTAKINPGTAKGVVFIPENFTDVYVNMFFNMGEGFPRVKVQIP